MKNDSDKSKDKGKNSMLKVLIECTMLKNVLRY